MPAKKTVSRKATTRKTTAAAKTTKKSASTKSRTTSSKKSRAKSTKAGDREVTMDRRRKTDRRVEERADSTSSAATPKLERREKVQRRRQIDPTTCERDYSVEEVEFMNSMDEYKRTSGRMFPTCSEVLEVIRGLGYVKLTPAELATLRPETQFSPVDESGDEASGEPTPELQTATVGALEF